MALLDLRRSVARLIRMGAQKLRPQSLHIPHAVQMDSDARRIYSTLQLDPFPLERIEARNRKVYADGGHPLSDENRKGVHPLMVEFVEVMMKEFAARNLPFIVSEIKRSVARQAALFRQGFSRARGPQSPHVLGHAVDFIHLTKGWDLRPDEWAIIGAIGKEVARRRSIPIIWGGDFRSLYDPAHWELDMKVIEAREERRKARQASS